jgi:predicted DNA binding protein
VAVSQFEPTDAVRRALELQRDSPLVVDTPIRFTADDRLKVTYLGTDEAFRALYEYVADADYVTAEVLETGTYEADESSFERLLTARQEEVLSAAVDLGYYDDPRRASLEDVGDAVRKVESRVFGELVR